MLMYHKQSDQQMREKLQIFMSLRARRPQSGEIENGTRRRSCNAEAVLDAVQRCSRNGMCRQHEAYSCSVLGIPIELPLLIDATWK